MCRFNSNRWFLFVLILFLWIILCCTNDADADKKWHVVKKGKGFGISGIALFDQNGGKIGLLAVHDNKMPGQVRAAIVTIVNETTLEYTPLEWPDSSRLPMDFESVTALPDGYEPSFMALTSKGEIFHFKITGLSISVLKVFSLPNSGRRQNFEGLSIHRVENRLLAVWAHGGENNNPAVIYWGWFTPLNYNLSVLGSAELKIPWPTQPDVRHISDIKITPQGVAIITAASDPGDTGPFQSAAYFAGRFYPCGNTIEFKPADRMIPFRSFKHHKVEAIELAGDANGIVFATDDEDFGSSITFPKTTNSLPKGEQIVERLNRQR